MESVRSTGVAAGRDVGEEMGDGADDGGWELAGVCCSLSSLGCRRKSLAACQVRSVPFAIAESRGDGIRGRGQPLLKHSRETLPYDLTGAEEGAEEVLRRVQMGESGKRSCRPTSPAKATTDEWYRTTPIREREGRISLSMLTKEGRAKVRLEWWMKLMERHRR